MLRILSVFRKKMGISVSDEPDSIIMMVDCGSSKFETLVLV
jgi:hypothetical protein